MELSLRADIEAAARRGLMTSEPSRGILADLPAYFEPGETARFAVEGHLRGWGVLALTDRRIVFVRGRNGHYPTIFPFHQLCAVNWHPRLFSAWIYVTTTSGVELVTGVHKRAGHWFVDDIVNVLPAPMVEPEVPDVSDIDIAARLRQLAKLRDEGLISIEDFEAKKAELLRRL